MENMWRKRAWAYPHVWGMYCRIEDEPFPVYEERTTIPPLSAGTTQAYPRTRGTYQCVQPASQLTESLSPYTGNVH